MLFVVFAASRLLRREIPLSQIHAKYVSDCVRFARESNATPSVTTHSNFQNDVHNLSSPQSPHNRFASRSAGVDIYVLRLDRSLPQNPLLGAYGGCRQRDDQADEYERAIITKKAHKRIDSVPLYYMTGDGAEIITIGDECPLITARDVSAEACEPVEGWCGRHEFTSASRTRPLLA